MLVIDFVQSFCKSREMKEKLFVKMSRTFYFYVREEEISHLNFSLINSRKKREEEQEDWPGPLFDFFVLAGLLLLGFIIF